MFLKGIGALILGLYIGLNAEYSEIKPVIPEYTENVEVKEFEGEKYYIIHGDYAGEYDIQELGFPTFDVADEFEQKTVMNFEEYKNYCKEWDIEQKYLDKNKNYIVVSEAFGGAAYVDVRLADIEITETDITLYAWIDANGLVGDTSAYVMTIPIDAKINDVTLQEMYTSKCFDELTGRLPNDGANYTVEDNKILAENTYLKSDNEQVNEIFNKMIDTIIEKRTMQVKKDGQIIEYIDFNSASSKFLENYYNKWGYIAYGEKYGESYTPSYGGKAYMMGYGGVPTVDKMLYYEALMNDLVMIISNNTEVNPYYEDIYLDDFVPLVDVTNCTVVVKEDKDNYIIIWNAENEGTEKYYINKKTYLLEKTINTRNVICEYEYANIPVKIPDDVAKNAHQEDIAYKPIIYLYPKEEKNVLVELKNADRLTCSYPEYIGAWNVMAKPNGDLQDLNTGRSLYSLYYESKNVIDFHVEKYGFVVKKENIIPFLEEKLAILGLTEREANEFIIYWLPILQENEYNYIRFATEDEINKNMPLEITPNPDTIIRVLMTYKGLENSIELEEQLLITPERNGFVAVEWGGTEIK